MKPYNRIPFINWSPKSFIKSFFFGGVLLGYKPAPPPGPGVDGKFFGDRFFGPRMYGKRMFD